MGWPGPQSSGSTPRPGGSWRSFWWRAVHCRSAAAATPSVPRKVAGAAGPAAGVPPKTERKRLTENRSHLAKTARCSSTLATRHSSLYDVENGTVASSQVVDTNGSGHGALAGF